MGDSSAEKGVGILTSAISDTRVGEKRQGRREKGLRESIFQVRSS